METSNTASEVLPRLAYHYETVITKDYGKVFVLPQEAIMICELTKGYVPIEEFKEIFQETISLIKKYQIKKFIFDKQHLTVFHQPSMEWYFITWKKEIYQSGLTIHRKILPQNKPFFAAAVEAGRAKIKEEYKDNIIDLLDIQYKASIEEAIQN